MKEIEGENKKGNFRQNQTIEKIQIVPQTI